MGIKLTEGERVKELQKCNKMNALSVGLQNELLNE